MTIPFRGNAGVRLRSALVERVNNGTYFVADSFSLIHADRSPSCLLQPEQNDLVLIAEDDMGRASIVTVLERETGKPAMLSVDGDLVVNSEGTVLFMSRQSINLMTPQVIMKACFGKITITDFFFSGLLFTSCGKKLQAVYENIEIKANKLVQQINRLYRRIKNEDSHFGRLQCQARDKFSICAQDASIEAEKRMQLNGSKIELG